MEEIEKELSSQIKLSQNNLLNENYEKFLQNPQIADFMDNYYYNIPNY